MTRQIGLIEVRMTRFYMASAPQPVSGGHVQPLVAESHDTKTGWSPVPCPASQVSSCPEACSSSMFVVTSSLRSTALFTSAFGVRPRIPTFRSGEWKLHPYFYCTAFSFCIIQHDYDNFSISRNVGTALSRGASEPRKPSNATI